MMLNSKPLHDKKITMETTAEVTQRIERETRIKQWYAARDAEGILQNSGISWGKDNVTGYTIPDDNPVALEQSLTQLICKEDLRKQMSLNSFNYAQSYSWDKITPRIIQQYDSLINN